MGGRILPNSRVQYSVAPGWAMQVGAGNERMVES